FAMVTDPHFLWHIFSSTVKSLFIMNFVSSHQIFQLLCNKAIPVSSTDHLLCSLPSKMNVRTAME
ncbi:hypothetical protein, partial [Wolbachia endosymbiont of Nasonia vitripennis]